MSDQPQRETKVQVNSECLARVYAETVATNPGMNNFLSYTKTFQAEKWKNFEQKLSTCQNLSGNLPDLEITVTLAKGQPPRADLKHLERK